MSGNRPLRESIIVLKAHAIRSKDNPAFKVLKERLSVSGERRTHALLPGAKLIEAYLNAPQRRLRALRWLRLEGPDSHPLEAQLPLPTLILPGPRMRELTDQPSPPDLALEVSLGPEPSEPLGSRSLGLWGMQDPGNLGAALRAAAAFGFTDALLGPGSADPYSLKALRGAMGATFRLELRRVAAVEGPAWILDGGPGATPLEQIDLREPLRLWIGSEGQGWKGVHLPPDARRVAIPTRGVESLNAAVAAGIACFEVQRRLG